MEDYIRQPSYKELIDALTGQVNLIQAIVGPRQVGKTTLALQIHEKWKGPKLYLSADELATPNLQWIEDAWKKIRANNLASKKQSILILDEVQKIPKWSSKVKQLFDEDKRQKNNIRILLLGSAALLMQRGLGESLGGRFELHKLFHWSFKECKDYFKTSLNEFIYFGGYPSAIKLRKNETRWSRYIRDSLIETVLSKDILLLSPVTKPSLLRQTFSLATNYPAQSISYQKMLGTLQDAGNTTTIASYLQLLSKAFLVAPLERWSGTKIRQRGSIPKLITLDNGIISSMSSSTYKDTLKDRSVWGRLVENAVGAQLYFIASKEGGELFYFQDRDKEVDYILKIGNKITAIEVKSGDYNKKPASLNLFKTRYKNIETLIISNSKKSDIDSIKNINLNDFFLDPSMIIFKTAF